MDEKLLEKLVLSDEYFAFVRKALELLGDDTSDFDSMTDDEKAELSKMGLERYLKNTTEEMEAE